jgi:hypothetical protein
MFSKSVRIRVQRVQPVDEERDIEAVIRLSDIGLDPRRWYACEGIYNIDIEQGRFIIKKPLPPWGARVYHVYPVDQRKECLE